MSLRQLLQHGARNVVSLQERKKEMTQMFSMRKAILLIAALFPIGLTAVLGQTLPLDSAVRTGKLTNGLTYFIRHNEAEGLRSLEINPMARRTCSPRGWSFLLSIPLAGTLP